MAEKSPARVAVGHINNSNGKKLESIVSLACEKYKELDIAVIEKSHEPVQVLGPVSEQGGIYKMRFAQKAKPDFEGVLKGGRAILFDAKFTAQDRIKSSAVSVGQANYLDIYESMGAVSAVLVCVKFKAFYMISWNVWKNMKKKFGHLYMNQTDLEPYRVLADSYPHFLDGLIKCDAIKNRKTDKKTGKRYDKERRLLHTGEYVRASGRYEYKHTDAFGNRISIYADTLSELREKEKINNAYQAGGKHTLNEAKEACLYMDESRVAVTSFINYSITYDRYIADVFGNKDVKCITPIMVEKFYLTLNKKQKLKVSTVNSVHTVLHMILEYALKSRWILSNPSSGCMKCLDNAKRREKHEGPLTLSKQVLCSYLKYLVKEGSEMSDQAIIILVIAFVGCRFGEAAGLRDVDIDHEKKMISINHTLWYRNRKDLGDSRKCGFGVTPAKSAKSVRCLPMENEGLLDLFGKRAGRNKKIKRCVIDGYSGFLFVKETGFPYTNKDINIYLRKSIKRYNDYEITEAEKEQREPLLMPENITVHIFRRTAATLMLENGYQMPDIMSILGHVDLRTTSEHYCFPSMEHKSKVIKCLPIGEVEV